MKKNRIRLRVDDDLGKTRVAEFWTLPEDIDDKLEIVKRKYR